MSNTNPCDMIDGLADYIRQNFRSEVLTQVYVANDPASALELIASAGHPNGLSIVVFYNSDAPNDPTAPDGDTVVDAVLGLIVYGNPGLSATTSRVAPNILRIASELRKLITNANAENILNGYTVSGMGPLQGVDGTVLHGYRMTIGVTYAFEI